MPYILRIHPDHPGLDRLRHAVRPPGIARPDITSEAIVDVVGLADRIFLIGEGDGREDRPENLFTRDAHTRVRATEQSRLDEVAAFAGVVASTTADDPRSFAARDLHITHDLLEMSRMDERPDLGFRVERVADAQLARARCHSFDELVVDRGMDEKPARRRAALS